MKLLVLSVTVAMLFAAGDGLRCYHCSPPPDGRNCEVKVETCPPGKDACTAVTFLTEPYISYQECVAMSDCRMWQMNSHFDMKCCAEDLCNTF
ncbi:CD59 glycoprotein-like [Synchiropus splendidus]|uniref:CD59 glycoprotein-like n=1 Tax=Synchiropus splendidus TaxID=270530 RepID=UPI00237D96C9|nr:CD59 glycoprotein-like [Synchiropus splendidus]